MSLPEQGNAKPLEKRGGTRPNAGRKPIGVTRKISLTLPKRCWDEIDRRCDGGNYSISEILREVIEDYLKESDLL
ncbi:ribbon-helix-helix domain-containing protein [Gorillibacterium sp. sgz500922]|uniref:ribbon-helix-helix domain-containing protein n=1 Tax=Gorillibacterium sp. sgz500922 TaxID=3446694 RepID=UPI003F679862